MTNAAIPLVVCNGIPLLIGSTSPNNFDHALHGRGNPALSVPCYRILTQTSYQAQFEYEPSALLGYQEKSFSQKVLGTARVPLYPPPVLISTRIVLGYNVMKEGTKAVLMLEICKKE